MVENICEYPNCGAPTVQVCFVYKGGAAVEYRHECSRCHECGGPTVRMYDPAPDRQSPDTGEPTARMVCAADHAKALRAELYHLGFKKDENGTG